MTDLFGAMAAAHGLKDQSGTSMEGLHERYLYSPGMTYRYAFGRWWGEPKVETSAVWVLLNPATGDTERRRRPTLERCISWSRAAAYSGLVIVNIFGFRATAPTALRAAPDPVGPCTDEALQVFTSAGAETIVAWGGSHGQLRNRSREVVPLLESPMCLGTTKHGEPRHPLYVPGAAQLAPWDPAQLTTEGVI